MTTSIATCPTCGQKMLPTDHCVRTEQFHADPERVAQMIAHRACCGVEHDPTQGKLHGYCIVCGVPWPCEYAGKSPNEYPADLIREQCAKICESKYGPDSSYQEINERLDETATEIRSTVIDPAAVSAAMALRQFALAILEESRGELADLDGGWIQDKAEELKLLVRVPVNQPCGDECRCAEWGDFPMDCLRYSNEVQNAIGAATNVATAPATQPEA